MFLTLSLLTARNLQLLLTFQDTVIALQALSEYAIQSQLNDIEMDCHVTCDATDYDNTFSLEPNNAIVRQHDKFKVSLWYKFCFNGQRNSEL